MYDSTINEVFYINVIASNSILNFDYHASYIELLGELSNSSSAIISFEEIVNKGNINGEYTKKYSDFKVTKFIKEDPFFEPSILGYKTISDWNDSKIEISYMPSYGGSSKGEIIPLQTQAKGNNKEPFSNLLYAKAFRMASLSKINNGIYTFKELNPRLRYIKEVRFHVQLE